MPELMTPYVLIVAAGLDPSQFATKAWAPQPDEERPALVSGLMHGGVYAVIRAWHVEDDPNHSPFAHEGWIAVATVSKNPALATGELSPEEAERLRAERLTPAGYDAPVGQKQVIGRADPKPYTPPVQPIEPAIPSTAVEIEDDTGATGPIPEALPCGPECLVLKGPEGTQEYHGAGCER